MVSHKIGSVSSGEMYTEHHECLVWNTKARLYPIDKGGDFAEDDKYF